LPGLAGAFDEEAMKGHLQAALFGTARPTYTVERCTPTAPLYAPGEGCLVRYRFRATSNMSDEVLEPIVMGRVFPNRTTSAAYMADKLAPLAARMRGRPEVAAFAVPAALIEPLNMVVHVWPIDGELPTLVDATDPQRMIEIFRETLQKDLLVDNCHIELVSYRRRQRCVLRYTIAGKTLGSDESRRLVVYGKVTGVGSEALTGGMIDALRDQIRERPAPLRFALPRSFGSRPDLKLSLLEALRGEPRMGAALKSRLRGRPQQPDAPPLEEMIATCGYVAAALHASHLELGRPRSIDDELGRLRGEIAMSRQFVPQFGDRAQSWLERIADHAEQSEPLKLRLGHGDFKYQQLLFDDTGCALVDLDTICEAEPALDLGKFLAHMRAEGRRMQERGSRSPRLVEELAERFLRAYVRGAGDSLEDEPRMRRRTALYEAIALLHMALRGQQNLNQRRVEILTALLDERLA
jgi:Phosphotransferase enzyme family